MAISLRIPDDVKKRIARLAARRDTTAHAFMLDAIREKVEDEGYPDAVATDAGPPPALLRINCNALRHVCHFHCPPASIIAIAWTYSNVGDERSAAWAHLRLDRAISAGVP